MKFNFLSHSSYRIKVVCIQCNGWDFDDKSKNVLEPSTEPIWRKSDGKNHLFHFDYMLITWLAEVSKCLSLSLFHTMKA